MAGIYIHIPFCKQSCHYCDFHFSTTLKNKELLLDSIFKEIVLRKNYLTSPTKINTIYFGGGTPSLLSPGELNKIFDVLNKQYGIADDIEITLEANPDDLTAFYLKQLKQTPVNRLSIGIQSFRNEDLTWMNRAHTAIEAEQCVLLAAENGFQNITVDLIYGIPQLSLSDWEINLNKAFSLPLQHLSCYCLTVEPKTALHQQIKKGISKMPDDELSLSHFELLMQLADQNSFIQYEISNFGKEGFQAKHNSNYWAGIPYIGFGPSAHSFDGETRQWNIANNALYIKGIEEHKLRFEKEELTMNEKYNEYVLTSLRTMWGVNSNHIQRSFGEQYLNHFSKEAASYIESKKIILEKDRYLLSKEGKYIADRIASDLFV